MNEDINLIFLGDIVGRPGRYAVKFFLKNVEAYLPVKPDFVIANCENASHGFGLTEKNYNELLEYGIDILTSGNHIWDRKDIFNYIDNTQYLLRPLNYPEGTPGIGAKIFTKENNSIGVINLLGRVFMDPYESPWTTVKNEILKLQLETPIVLVDFHAEATAEKMAFGNYLSHLGVSAMVGTHTHVPTADERLLNDHMAYITDVGFCGANNSVIGMDLNSSIARLSTLLPVRYEVPAIDEAIVCGVRINIDKKTGVSKGINRFKFYLNLKKLIEEDKLK